MPRPTTPPATSPATPSAPRAGSRTVLPALLAAALVAVAATATSVASSAGWATGGASATPSSTASAPSAPSPSSVSSVSGSSDGSDGSTGFSTGSRTASSVVFVGHSPDLNPRGGTARSFACRAAADLGWACHVAGGGRAVPETIAADVVVVALTARDDAETVSALLGGLPEGVGPARRVLLGELGVSRDAAAERRFAGVRRLGERVGAAVVDPVAEHWITTANRQEYLDPDGELTAAGHLYAARRLSAAVSEALGR